MVAAHIPAFVVLLGLSPEFLPAGDKLTGAFLPNFPNSLLSLHRQNGGTHLTVRSFMRKRSVCEVGTLDVTRIVFAKGVQHVARCC